MLVTLGKTANSMKMKSISLQRSRERNDGSCREKEEKGFERESELGQDRIKQERKRECRTHRGREEKELQTDAEA